MQLSLFDDCNPETNNRKLTTIDFNRDPTNKEICMMCHFSSECDNCCKICKEKCNTGQVCQIGIKGQANRLNAWMDIVLHNENFDRLKKFIK